MINWVSIPEYTKQTGLGRHTIQKMIERGELIATETVCGGQVRIKVETNPELDILNERLEETNKMIKQLCDHLGLKHSKTGYF